jgi:ectoine hydroxylase-related dioxygenase (phytanoyl-CoA dioxygenase family)
LRTCADHSHPGTPIVTIWTAIDAATVESGCMEMVPGVHKHGILNAGNFTSAGARSY